MHCRLNAVWTHHPGCTAQTDLAAQKHQGLWHRCSSLQTQQRSHDQELARPIHKLHNHKNPQLESVQKWTHRMSMANMVSIGTVLSLSSNFQPIYTNRLFPKYWVYIFITFSNLLVAMILLSVFSHKLLKRVSVIDYNCPVLIWNLTIPSQQP